MSRRSWLAIAFGIVAVLAGCTNTPPPPLVTTAVGTSRAPKVDTGEVIVGVDRIAGGYNPHKLSDQSAVTTAVANLVLPSVFRIAPDGTPVLDRALMVSAEVTSADPYTVTYRIRQEASWSDTAPIAAEDFVYLWEQLRTVPGGIGSAGYRLISDITAQDGGKVVQVTFDSPYPGWRSLFVNLLPAHLLKDAPGGWATALRDSFPASGGPFVVGQLDPARGELVLDRNDRYWAQPATLDRIILRRAEIDGVVEALTTGHNQVALLDVDRAGLSVIEELDDSVQQHTVPRSSVVSLVLRPHRPQLADVRVRRALVAMLNRERLVRIGTGGGPAETLRADAHVLAPSAAGYTPTLPPSGPPADAEPGTARRLLNQAGYTLSEETWTKNGRPLRVVIAAAEGREIYRDIAEELRAQLVERGVEATVITPPADQLYTTLTAAEGQNAPEGEAIDLAVLPQPAGGDPATVLATNFGCASSPPEAVDLTPANPIGFCDEALQPTIEAALTGALSMPEALSTVEPALWQAAVAVPLYQEADLLVVRPEMSGVSVGPPFSGPFSDAAEWRRSTR